MTDAPLDAIKALLAAQRAMGPALKDATNPHFKSKYADLGAVMDACRDPLLSNGFAIMPPPGRDELGHFIETQLVHESGHVFAGRVYLALGKNDMQGLGSAQTYARRYGLMAMAGIVPEDDDGHGAVEGQRRAAEAEKREERATAEMARDRMLKVIGNAKSLPALGEAWQAMRPEVKGLPEPMQNEVTAAKDTRKAALTGPDPAMQSPQDGHVSGAFAHA